MFSLLLVFLDLVLKTSSQPHHQSDARQAGTSKVSFLSPRTLSTGLNLTILPVGDSITVGVGSSDGNGYRLYLMDMLKDDGQTVSFMGTQSSGRNNTDNLNEGFGWNNITQILEHLEADNVLSQQPDLVLIHAGTNDNDAMDADPTDAATRLGTLIDYILDHDSDAVVLVAALVQNKYHPEETALFNARVPGIITDRFMRGHKISMVNMSSIGDLSDLLHPNDVGYQHMAQAWYDAIVDVPTAWWPGIQKSSSEPNTTSISEDPAISLVTAGSTRIRMDTSSLKIGVLVGTLLILSSLMG